MNKTLTLRTLLVGALLASVVLAAGTGPVQLSPLQVMAVLLDKAGIHLPVSYSEGMANVLWQIRLPRVCLAVLAGAGLAVAGASMQGIFRNPLVEPGMIGVSAGASLAAVLTIVVLSSFQLAQTGFLGYYLLNMVTFAGAAITALVVFRLSRSGGKTITATLLLAGVAINALCGAFTGLVTSMATDAQLRNATFWTLGSLGGATWKMVFSLLPFVALPVLALPALSKSLNAWSLGEAEAGYLGVDVRKLKTRVVVLTTLCVGSCVAVAGIIGFIGLIVPHILRSISGNDHRALLPNSALLGATLLTLADICSRTIVAPAELPIGIVTAMIGTPLFLLLLMKQKKQIHSYPA